MMELEELLAALPKRSVIGNISGRKIDGVSHDSRSLDAAKIFVALRGTKFNAELLIPELTSSKCAAIVTENYRGDHHPSCPLIVVPNAREALSLLSYKLFGCPADYSWNVGVTGTNGKTSVAWLLAQAFTILRGPAVYSGTLGLEALRWAGGPEVIGRADSDMTTADPPALFAFLERAATLGAKGFISEVSSHAIHQRRVAAISWNQCIFTNLTRDHLDYHGTMEEYGAVKASLFLRDLRSSQRKQRSAVVNIDDQLGREIVKGLAGTGIQVVTFSTVGAGDVNLVRAFEQLHGTEVECRVGGKNLSLSYELIGDYNVSNVLAVVAALYGWGESLTNIQSVISKLRPVPGRLEQVGDDQIGVFVDYAHTPDALEKAQRSLRAVTKGRLITVFGCGGDRDRGKRPQMGKVVAELSEYVVITSDNPRSESPTAIIEDILPGIGTGKSVVVEPDRREAIARAISLAVPGDVVLVAGKGHEPYQEIKGVKHRFDDREVCRELFRKIHRCGD